MGHERPDIILSISLTQNHLKALPHVFLVHDTVDASLQHMFSLLARVRPPCDASQYVVHPITVITASKSGPPFLVFPNLAHQGYRIGMPDSDEDCDAFMLALRHAVNSIHVAGLVHLDLYPSNIMWRQDGRCFSIKIVDWDTVHAIDEPLTAAVRERLHHTRCNSRLALMNNANILTASAEFDDVLVRILHQHRHDAALKESDKAELDAGFVACVQQEALAAALPAAPTIIGHASQVAALAGRTERLHLGGDPDVATDAARSAGLSAQADL